KVNLMQKRLETDHYFSEAAIKERITQRYQREQALRIHVFITLMVFIGITFLVLLDTDVFLPNNTLNGTEILLALLKVALASGFFWLLLLFHAYVRRSREHLAAEIDAEMREAREYELRRYELARDPAYRLSDDGEIFYDD